MATPSITLSQSALLYSPVTLNYRMQLTVTNAAGIDPNVFVKQRLRALNKITFTDVFAAVAEPEQMESLCTVAPCNGTTYWRDSTVTITANTPEYANYVFQVILGELQQLVTDVEVLTELAGTGLYTITSQAVNFAMFLTHTHYRIPLQALPAGNSQTFTVDGVQYQQVVDQDTTLPGWLNCGEGDPDGYHFKYNTGEDAALDALWPVQPAKLPYAHLEQNGVVLDNNSFIIQNNILYWASNLYGQCPWPATYGVSEITPEEQVNLVFDFIV